jgi:TPR repeat protein
VIIFLNIFISFFFYFSQLYAQDLIKDEDYYKTGVVHYDNGNFKESFIVFFNLSEKGNKDAIYNLSNMYFEGIGTTQNFNKSLKYSWLCALNGNDKCIKKIKKIKDKLTEDEVIAISKDIPKRLEDNFLIRNDLISAFKLGYWFENFSPEIDFEKSYLWYSVSVSAGMYKAMKLRDRVGKLIDKKKLNELQIEANEIFTKNKYFGEKGNENDI